jgi:hypothetical protein
LQGWITALATAVLALFAIVTAVYAIRAFRKQSEQLAEQCTINAEQTTVLRLQATELCESMDERKREAGQRRRAQAARIFVGAPRDADGGPVFPYAQNASDYPIYEARLWYLNSEGQLPDGDNHEYRGTILPGGVVAGTRELPPRLALRCTVLTFRDANNVRWIWMPGGVLEEQSALPTTESVRAALRTFPPELGPSGRAGTDGQR